MLSIALHFAILAAADFRFSLFLMVMTKLFVFTQMQMRKYAYGTADTKHCFDLSGLISAVGVIDVYSRQ